MIAGAGFTLAAPIQREVAVLSNGTIYLAGGLDSASRSAAGVFSLQPSSGAMVRLGDVPDAFHDGAGALIEGHLVVFGGGSAEGSDVVQAFDLAGHTGAVVGHLPVILSDLSSATVGGTVYLVGGFDRVSPRREIYSTVDGVHFHVAARLPVGLRYPAVAAIGTNIIIAGGVSSAGPVSTVYRLDTRTGHLTIVENMPQRMGHAVAFSLGSFVYVAGGQGTNGKPLRTVFAIDLARGRISSIPSLRAGLSDAAAVSDGSTAWVLGGLRVNPVNEVLRATLEVRHS